MNNKLTRKNILFTGLPGCGKSTIIEKILKTINMPSTGFFTREIRERGRRAGFSITTLDGRQGILAHIDIPGRFRVGRYGVNLQDVDNIAVPSIVPGKEKVLIVIDEIGKMECLSASFRKNLLRALDSINPVLGSISMKGDAFIANLKKRPDILLIMVSEKNRDNLAEEFIRTLPEMLPTEAARKV